MKPMNKAQIEHEFSKTWKEIQKARCQARKLKEAVQAIDDVDLRRPVEVALARCKEGLGALERQLAVLRAAQACSHLVGYAKQGGDVLSALQQAATISGLSQYLSAR